MRLDLGADGPGLLLDDLLGLPAGAEGEQLDREHLEASVGGDSGDADADDLGDVGDLGRVLLHDLGEVRVGVVLGHDGTFQFGGLVSL